MTLCLVTGTGDRARSQWMSMSRNSICSRISCPGFRSGWALAEYSPRILVNHSVNCSSKNGYYDHFACTGTDNGRRLQSHCEHSNLDLARIYALNSVVEVGDKACHISCLQHRRWNADTSYGAREPREHFLSKIVTHRDRSWALRIQEPPLCRIVMVSDNTWKIWPARRLLFLRKHVLSSTFASKTFWPLFRLVILLICSSFWLWQSRKFVFSFCFDNSPPSLFTNE